MRVILVLALLLVAAAVGVPPPVQKQFEAWKARYGRTYLTAAEDNLRLENFYNNYLQVAELNAAARGEAIFELNLFADWSKAELRGLRGLRGNWTRPEHKANIHPSTINVTVPTSVDWRTKNVVSPVQDQQRCGSCWAFSAVSNIESVNAIAHGKLQKLSEQDLVDCDQMCGQYRFENGCDSGCSGGLMPNAFKFVMANGISTETAYPYTASDGRCRTVPSAAKISNWEFAPQDEDQLAAYVATKGPVSIAVDAEQWSFYRGGIMSSSTICPKMTDPAHQLDHGVNIVGYGVDGTTKYWLIRNSWRSDWGEQGYARLVRGRGFCGVNLFACSAIA